MSRAIERSFGNKNSLDQDFIAIYLRSVQAIDSGIRSRTHPFHLVSVASIGASGFPELRTVVLRHHDSEERDVAFHTDIRSPKVADFKMNQRVGLLMYDPEAKIQLRLKGYATVHHKDQFADKQWENTRKFSKYCYLNEAGSGSQVTARQACGVDPVAAEADEERLDRVAYEHFSVIKCSYFQMDYTHLAAAGHERAILQWDEKGAMTASWVAV